MPRTTTTGLVGLALLVPLLAPTAPAVASAVAPAGSARTSAATAAVPPGGPQFGLVGTYAVSREGEGIGGEVAAVQGRDMFVIKGTTLERVDVGDVSAPRLVETIDLSAYGASITSVAIGGDTVAASLPAADQTDPGQVVLLSRGGDVLTALTVGSLPDQVLLDERGRQLLVANEGSPNSYGQADSVDPLGTISVVDVRRALRGQARAVETIDFTDFDRGARRARDLPAGVRLNGPGARVSQDLEPEYVAYDASRADRAFVTLQENNAVAVLDLSARGPRVLDVLALGTLDHSQAGNGLDTSDRDGAIAIDPAPVRGLRMPDAVSSFVSGRQGLFVTANEGDAREYDGFADVVRAGTLTPAPGSAATGRLGAADLGRLNVSATDGRDAQGRSTQLTSFGTRSITTYDARGTVLWDSGDALERVVAARLPGNFGSNNDENSFDTRSDDKGPEPEGVDTGVVDGRTLAFVGLERVGGLAVFDITDPRAGELTQYLNNRTFDGETVGPDSGAEVVTFLDGRDSPTRQPLVLVTNEITGTVSFFGQVDPDGPGALSLLHNNDGESSLLPLANTVGGAPLPVGGVAAFETVTQREIASARAAGNSVVDVYAGDALLASTALSCSLPPNPESTPVYDAVAQRLIPYDAHVFGNHEFDFSPDFLERFVRTFTDGTAPNQAFLSANLDFSGEPGFDDLVDADGLVEVGSTTDGRVVGRSAVVSDLVTGLRFGIVGATTPALATISTPRDVVVTSSDLPSTAATVQAEVDRLTALGVTKVVLVSHLQDVANDRQLVPLLRDVDIAVAGGGDELLADPSDPLLPGDPAPVGAYPSLATAQDGAVVPIVTTSGNYRYVGRLDVAFGADGAVTVDDEASFPRRVVPQGERATALGLTDAVEPDALITDLAVEPVQECLAALQDQIATSEIAFNRARGTGSATGAVPAGGLGVRSAETNAGDLVADGFLASYDRYAAGLGLPPRSAADPVLAVQNGGGIRQDGSNLFPTAGAGPVSRQDTINVLPFANTMTVVRGVTPAQLKEVFERSVGVSVGGAGCTGGGQFLQVAGVVVTYDCSRTAQQVANPGPGSNAGAVVVAGQRVVTLSLDPAGTPSDTSDDLPVVVDGALVAGGPTADLVTNSFTAAGGDNYPTLQALTDKVNLPSTYEQTLVEYLLGGGFPVEGGFPTVQAEDPRYAQATGEGRVRFLLP